MFEIDISGKCEVMVTSSNDPEAMEQLIANEFVAKHQIQSNVDFPSISVVNIE